MNNSIPYFVHSLIKQKRVGFEQIMQMLNISKDSLYRRLRGDNDFLLGEVFTLQNAFKFSIDGFNDEYSKTGQHFETKVFEKLATPEATIDSYINNLYKDLETVKSLNVSNVYYAAKDLPLFSFFSSPVLASFKLYFWYITLFDANEKSLKYTDTWLPKNIIDKAVGTYELYSELPSTEIWNFETINSTLHQISYCKDLKLISTDDTKQLVDALLKYIDRLYINCETNKKNNKGSFKLYLNDILLLDNTVLFETSITSIFYLPFQTLNFLSNTNPGFTAKMKEWFIKQIKKSELVSGDNEKTRIKLMNMYKNNINNFWDAHY
jgi:hypothetical protein